MVLRLEWTVLLLATTAIAFSQTPASVSKPGTNETPAQAQVIPERTLKFTPVDTDSVATISPITSLPQCDTGGYLFLDKLDSKGLKIQSVVSFRGKESHIYSPSAISDLHDTDIAGYFPAKSTIGFLVHGSKDPPGPQGLGKSPAGIAWSSYHDYIAEFNRDGSYKGSIQLPVSYTIYHFAIFPSGELLVTGYDQINSTVRLLLLSSSGQISRTIDTPTLKTPAASNAPYGSVEGAKATRKVMGTFVFTPYNEDILVWRMNNNDPILDVSSEGGVREVPLQAPPGFVFVDMVPSNDRWVGHFRTQNTVENSSFTSNTYSYFELRPQDASISSRLLISGDVPQHIACESDGSYITYKVDKNNKLVLLKAD